MLENDIDEVLQECETLPYWWDLSATRQLCIADLVFNMGLTRWLGFVKANAAIVARDYGRAADEIKDSRYYRQTKRRARKITEAFRTDHWPD
jgi:lysozyme